MNSIALEPNRWTAEKIPYFKLVDLLPAIAAHGFESIELWQYHIDRLTDAEFSEVCNALAAAGISVPVLGIYPRIHLEGREAEEEFAHVARLLDRAAVIGCDIVKMFTGSVASGQLDDAGRVRSVDFLRLVTGRAKQLRLRLTGETHANTLFDTVESTLRTVEELDPATFGVCFQPYDENLAGATGAFTATRDRIWHLHYQGRKGRDICLLSEADLDYGAYTRFIAESGFAGYLCIEFVKDCVVASPELMNVETVLANAEKDREFVLKHLSRFGSVA